MTTLYMCIIFNIPKILHLIFGSQLSSVEWEVHLLISSSHGHCFPLAHKVVIVVKTVVDIGGMRMSSLGNSRKFTSPSWSAH